jgi:hypothetical protein
MSTIVRSEPFADDTVRHRRVTTPIGHGQWPVTPNRQAIRMCVFGALAPDAGAPIIKKAPPTSEGTAMTPRDTDAPILDW